MGKDIQDMKSSNNMAMIQNILSLFCKFAGLSTLPRRLLILYFYEKYMLEVIIKLEIQVEHHSLTHTAVLFPIS